MERLAVSKCMRWDCSRWVVGSRVQRRCACSDHPGCRSAGQFLIRVGGRVPHHDPIRRAGHARSGVGVSATCARVAFLLTAVAPPQAPGKAQGRPQKMLYIMYNKLQERSFRETLGDLVESGLVVLPSRSLRKDELAVMVEVSGKPVAEMVAEDLFRRIAEQFHEDWQAFVRIEVNGGLEPYRLRLL